MILIGRDLTIGRGCLAHVLRVPFHRGVVFTAALIEEAVGS